MVFKKLFFLLLLQIPFLNAQEAGEKKIRFSYSNEDITNIIYVLSEAKDVNVILPQGAAAIKSKVTLTMPGLLTIDQAWDMLGTILDIAGYAMLHRPDGYHIVKRETGKEGMLARNPMSLYIGVKPFELPDTDEVIRYLYYFSNIKVDNDPKNEVNEVLQELLPAGTLYKFDPTTNALLISAKSELIKEAMRTIVELDQTSFQEKMLFLELHFTQATMVAELFNSNILRSNNLNRYNLDARRQPENSYFTAHARIIAVPHRNALVLLGRTQAVDRLHEFIEKNIDVEPRSGNSILHIYQLQYLDAVDFAKVLTEIIETARAGGTGQSYAGESKSSIQREFDEVIIRPDRPADTDATHYFGGNKLIIACRNDDWAQIKKLIEDLDTPQPQVLLEILVADLSLDDTRMLGSLSRNPAKIPILSGMQFQSAQLPLGANGTVGVITDSVTDATTVAGNLLRDAFDSSGNLVDAGTQSAAIYAPVGATVLSLNDNDGNTWSIMQIMKKFSHTKILSHPHVIAVNNKEALVKVGEQRYLLDEATGSSSTTVQNLKPIDADLTVKITPRISSANTVTLTVTVDVNNFLPGANTDNARTTRKVSTSATIENNAIFALGGLVSVDSTQGITDVPPLSKVPIIGWFFKRQQGEAIKNNLTVFISPTIIQPRLRQGMDRYTADYVDVVRRYAHEGDLFDNLNQPVNRWFFRTGLNLEEITDAFVQKGEVTLSLDRRVPPPPVKAQKERVRHKSEGKMLEESAHHEFTKEYEQIEAQSDEFRQEHQELFVAEQEEILSPETMAPATQDAYGQEDSDVMLGSEPIVTEELPSSQLFAQKEVETAAESLKSLLKVEENPFDTKMVRRKNEQIIVHKAPITSLKDKLKNEDNPFARRTS